MTKLKNIVLSFLRKILPKRVKRWFYKLSLSKDVEGSMFFHLNNLRKLGCEPDFVVDIGAFRGEWTKEAMTIFPSAQFIMIEPQDDKQDLLSAMAEKNKNLKYVKSLIGRESRDEVIFFEMESGSSIYEEQTSHPRTHKKYGMKTLDQLLRGEDAPGEYFLKLDVQGAEMDVLEGAAITLDKCNFLLLEVSVLNYNAGAPLLHEIVAYLCKKDFVVFDIVELRRKADGTLIQVDLIFSKLNSPIRTKVNYKK